MSEIEVVVSDEEILVQVIEEPDPIVVEVGTPGPEGVQGPSGTIEEVQVEQLAEGEQPTVENIGTPQNAIIKFGIPKGDTGDPFSNVDGGRADSVYGGIEPIDGGGVD